MIGPLSGATTPENEGVLRIPQVELASLWMVYLLQFQTCVNKFSDIAYIRPPKIKCPRYDSKLHLIIRYQSWILGGIKRGHSLPLLPGPLWIEVEVPDKVSSKDKYNCLII